MSKAEYRWNQTQAAAAYDAAAPVIHPKYVEVQDALLQAIPFAAERQFAVVDLGGGSGRLLERILDRYTSATATLVDQSPAFLDIARKRLAKFGERAHFVTSCAQDDWHNEVGPFNLAVSTSALHHLEPQEKQEVFQRIAASLSPGGVFINGDEHRPADDGEYRRLLEGWDTHMTLALQSGRIPETFRDVLAKWKRRNLDEFDRPRVSGEDCLETIETQTEYLLAAGFDNVRIAWRHELWAVFVAGPSSAAAA